MYEIQEYSPPSGRWYTIAVSDNMLVAESELKRLIRKNGDNYRLVKANATI